MTDKAERAAVSRSGDTTQAPGVGESTDTSQNAGATQSAVAGRTTVAIARCEDYDEARVEAAVREAVELAGGLSSAVKPGDKVLLKVNLLAPVGPDVPVTTHPSVVRAMIKVVKEAGGTPIVADAPGFLFAGAGTRAIVTSGIKAVADEMGVEALQFETVENPFVEVEVPDGVWLKTIHAARVAIEADVIISLPKLKTHSGTRFTGAVKNMFGAVATNTRKAAHCLGRFERVGGAVVDIYSAVKPKFAVMDAVIGMEGEGPRHGDARQAGLIIASADCVALDAVASRVIGFDPADVATTKAANERGVGNGDLSRISVLGESIDDVKVDFKKPSTLQSNPHPFLLKIVERFLVVEPRLDQEKCTRCAICAKSCPVSVITMGPYPVIDRKDCIECYCCNEMCPDGAMGIYRSWLAKRLEA